MAEQDMTGIPTPEELAEQRLKRFRQHPGLSESVLEEGEGVIPIE